MTDTTKYSNISVSKKTYSDLQRLSKEILPGDTNLSISKTVFSKWVFTVSGSQLFIIFSSLIGGPVYYACHINFSYVSISFSAFVFESFAIWN